MSIGYSDFQSRELIEQYNVVNRVQTSYVLTVGAPNQTYTFSGLKGILKKVGLKVSALSNQSKITTTLKVDTKSLSVIVNDFTNPYWVSGLSNGVLEITFFDVSKATSLIQLSDEIMFFDSFSFYFALGGSLITTSVDLDIVYFSASPTIIYSP